MKYIFAFALIFMMVACSSGKQLAGDSAKSENDLFKRAELKNIEMEASATFDFKDFQNSAFTKLKVANRDSVSLTVNGPFGIVVGKLYSTRDKFLFVNYLENLVFVGSPTAENIERTARIHISYEDMIAIFRNEATQDFAKYTIVSQKDDQIIYMAKTKEQFSEFVVYSKKEAAIVQYQRKDKENKLILNVFCQDFKKNGSFNLPNKIVFKFPEVEGSVTYDISSIVVNEAFNKPFKFEYSKNAKKIELD